jgi:hypothetical protein
MATWVLVLMYAAKSIAVVPGYLTEAECLRSGAAYVKDQGWAAVAKTVCIPGPTK